MSSKEKLTQAVERRKATLARKAGGGKATPENLRLTRKQLKRAQRGLDKMARAEKIRGGKKKAGSEA